MKLRNLLLVVTLATAGLLGSSKTHAQAFQTGDIISDDYWWYHSDGTFAGYLGYGSCGGQCFVGAGPFDLQGNHYETYDYTQNQSISIQKFDPSGNLVKTIVSFGGPNAPVGGGPLGLDAHGDIFIDYWYYTNTYYYVIDKYDQTGKALAGWNSYTGVYNFDLSRDQKTLLLSGTSVIALNLKTRATKNLYCGTTALRVLGDGTYLASDNSNNVMHCTAAGRLIRTYPIAAAAGDNLVEIAPNPDGQSFLVGAYLSGNLYKVDFSTGTVTTLITGGVGSNVLEVYGMVHVGQCPLLPSTFAVNFPSQKVGTTSSAKTDTLTDSGAGPVPVGTLALGGANSGDFAMTENCSNKTLGAGKKCSASLTFTPTATGKRTATLQVPHSAGSPICTPVTIAVQGKGTP